MNVLIVTDTFAPDINGVARTLETLARGLARLGHGVEVVTTTRGPSVRNAPGVVSIRTANSMRLSGYREVRAGMAGAGWLGRVIRDFGADVIYVAVESLMGINAVRAARRLGVPVVSGFHTNFHSYADHYRVAFLKNIAAHFLRWFHNRTARTLTPSHSTAEHLRQLGVNDVGVLGRGVDTELFHPARRDRVLRRDWGATADVPVIAFIGRIAAEKNLPLAVQSMTRVMERVPGARGVFVGDGPKAQALRKAQPQFIHAGARSGLDLAAHYASADIFIFPSLTETYGNVLPEALASGLVTVSYDYAAARELVEHGRNGFTAPPRNEAAFLAAVDEACARWDDAVIRSRARESSLNLSWSTIIGQFEHELAAARQGFFVPDTRPATQLPACP